MTQTPTDALRLVPVEPTEAMIDAYFDTCRRHGFHAHINATSAWTSLLKAAPASPLPGGGWQDISTLPQKGAFTPLVDVWATGPGKDSDVSHYRITDCWRREDGVWFSMGIGELKQSRVTHWMPLPAAPKGDA